MARLEGLDRGLGLGAELAVHRELNVALDEQHLDRIDPQAGVPLVNDRPDECRLNLGRCRAVCRYRSVSRQRGRARCHRCSHSGANCTDCDSA